MGFVMRRSLPSVTALLGRLLAVGAAAVSFLGAALWFPAAFAVAALAVQFAVNPVIIQRLIPATIVPHDGTRYLTTCRSGGSWPAVPGCRDPIGEARRR